MTEKVPKYRIVDVIKSSNKNAKSSILIIYTGGTVGMELDASGSLVAPEF